ncbi:MAG: hypothetical protein AAF849_22120 [Bacteroidota bacterium]
MTDQLETTAQEDRPPILKTWNQLYWIVLILHALVIAAFYLFTEFYK